MAEDSFDVAEDTPVEVVTRGQVYSLAAADKFLSVMRTKGSVIRYDSSPFEYPAQTDTVITHSDLLNIFPNDILNFRVGRFLVIVGSRPAENHPKLGNFMVYSSKIPGITVYTRKRAAK